MSTMTDRLIAGGYITRTVDPTSRRQNVLELTDKGRTLLSGIGTALTTVDATIPDTLGADAATFFDLARRLRNGLGGTIPGAKKTRANSDVTDWNKKTTATRPCGHTGSCGKTDLTTPARRFAIPDPPCPTVTR